MNKAQEQFLEEVQQEMRAAGETFPLTPARLWLFLQDYHKQGYRDQGLLYADLEDWLTYQQQGKVRKNEEPYCQGRRVENLGDSVSVWCEQTGNGASTRDLCVAHAKRLDTDPHCYDGILFPSNGDPVGEDGWGGDVEHPPYDDEYHCAIPFCGVLLGGY